MDRRTDIQQSIFSIELALLLICYLFLKRGGLCAILHLPALVFLRTFLYDEDTPNAETIASMEEVKEMIRTGSGEHWRGSTADLFASILAGED